MLKFQLPAYQEIPNVGLYLEQTLKYINDTFSAFRSVELTKSMISNYVKLGYLRRPVKKQYDREQIAALLFIAVSKQVLSMDNIGKLFRMQVELGSMEESYTAFKADFDYSLDKRFANDHGLFMDGDHLNRNGARIFTDILLKDGKEIHD